MERLVVAISQLSITDRPARNGAKIRSAVRRAAAAGARLILFPEGALSGYAKEQHASWDALDPDEVAAELERVCEVARELRVWVIVGSAHPLPAPQRPHNSVYAVSDEGAVVARYDKRICSHTESTRFYTPGSEPVVFDVDGLRFGCVLCIEVNFPELFAEYERLGVDCVLPPAYPVDAILAVKARAHAAIHNSWVAVSAPLQTQHLVPSALFGPNGDVVARAEPDGDLVLATIDPGDPAFRVSLELARPWRTAVRRRLRKSCCSDGGGSATTET